MGYKKQTNPERQKKWQIIFNQIPMKGKGLIFNDVVHKARHSAR